MSNGKFILSCNSKLQLLHMSLCRPAIGMGLSMHVQARAITDCIGRAPTIFAWNAKKPARSAPGGRASKTKIRKEGLYRSNQLDVEIPFIFSGKEYTSTINYTEP